eukprot:113331-Pelagomonas_calceolata.AAC.1
MDLFLAGRDQPQANQPNDLTEGINVRIQKAPLGEAVFDSQICLLFYFENIPACGLNAYASSEYHQSRDNV